MRSCGSLCPTSARSCWGVIITVCVLAPAGHKHTQGEAVVRRHAGGMPVTRGLLCTEMTEGPGRVLQMWVRSRKGNCSGNERCEVLVPQRRGVRQRPASTSVPRCPVQGDTLTRSELEQFRGAVAAALKGRGARVPGVRVPSRGRRRCRPRACALRVLRHQQLRRGRLHGRVRAHQPAPRYDARPADAVSTVVLPHLHWWKGLMLPPCASVSALPTHWHGWNFSGA